MEWLSQRWLQTPEMQQQKVLQMFCKITSPCCPTPGNEGLYLPGTSSSSSPAGEYNETNSTHYCHKIAILSTVQGEPHFEVIRGFTRCLLCKTEDPWRRLK